MITIKDFLEACQYKITGAALYQWKCFGPNARYLDSDSQNYSLTMVFDTVTQEVYEAEVHTRNAAYRIINPNYLEAFKAECSRREMDFSVATDEFKYTDLEVDADWIEKATAIVMGKEYDTRIQVPLTLSDSEMFQLMQLAHENDITLNQMVEKMLREMIERGTV